MGFHYYIGGGEGTKYVINVSHRFAGLINDTVAYSWKTVSFKNDVSVRTHVKNTANSLQISTIKH